MNITAEFDKRYNPNEEYLGINKKINNLKPLLSVCIQTYQHVNYIEECIESVLLQKTNFPIEINIADDGSTDGTREICIKYATEHQDKIRLFLRDRETSQLYDNNGVFITRFNGKWNRKSARGKYIAICEGDDYWTDPLKLQKQVDFLEANEDYGLVCTDMVCYNQNSTQFIKSNIIPLEGDGFEELINWRNQVWTLTTCFRKELSDGLPFFDSNMYFTGDRHLFLYISLHSKLKFLSDKTAVYRILEESSSHFKSDFQEIEFTFKVANTMLYYLDKHPVNNVLHRTVFYNNMLARFKYSRATGSFKIYQTVILNLQFKLDIKHISLHILYLLCKIKPFFLIYSNFYRKRLK